ncbi:2OG-Fe(II) oxygenase [Nocardia sp. NPDC005978]|uniref:2OG-Fe(II) oxygenase n=1 Tax=Nocardia sp. NPDC005978 TaxID=3156725 RepID=UPI00339E738F
MTVQTLATIGTLLDATRTTGSYATRRTAPAADLELEVAGVGVLSWPVSPEQARQLCSVARPAHYGLREQTLLDTSVRDTWQVPRELVRIDEKRWGTALAPILDTVRADLGLPADRTLSAELHSMLVYEKGQFFHRHQDSEKAEGMIGTLVVTMPSEFSGGELVVEHRGERVSDAGAPGELALVAFYADCDHEVLPVTEGYRITLTYNLIAAAGGSDTGGGDVGALAELVREYFTTPVPMPKWRRGDGPEHQPPTRLVYLLEHQYSQRGIGWDQLKGVDAARAAALVAAAENSGYQPTLALAEVREANACDYLEDEEWMCGRRRRWELVENTWTLVEENWESIDGEEDYYGADFDHGNDRPADHPEYLAEVVLGDSYGPTITLKWWMDRAGAITTSEGQYVHDDELCPGTTGSPLEPFGYRLTGYMGNEGNTVDRWYRRAAIVVHSAAPPASL